VRKKKASCTKTKNSYKLELTLLYYFKFFNFHFIIFLNFLNEQTDTKSINIYIYIYISKISISSTKFWGSYNLIKLQFWVFHHSSFYIHEHSTFIYFPLLSQQPNRYHKIIKTTITAKTNKNIALNQILTLSSSLHTLLTSLITKKVKK